MASILTHASSPAEVLQLFERYVDQANLEGLISLYTPNAIMVEQPGKICHGQAAIAQALARLIQSQVRISIAVKDVLQTADIAFVASKWSVTQRQGDIWQVVSSGQGTDVMQLQTAGHWLLLIDNPFGSQISLSNPCNLPSAFASV